MNKIVSTWKDETSRWDVSTEEAELTDAQLEAICGAYGSITPDVVNLPNGIVDPRQTNGYTAPSSSNTYGTFQPNAAGNSTNSPISIPLLQGLLNKPLL